ncbi:hypothetical protein [Paraburkholderia caledonica]|uniref:hypothetical protein n=1 Tax=Paraburkholderia caledonica TaxID=134536 RepID=UPI000B3F8279|nr:hypothetical protein [Paraburkholderia caledonica]
MSYDLMVYLWDDAMPMATDWQDRIVDEGFPVKLSSDFETQSMAGFFPVSMYGSQSGFEYLYRHADDEELFEVGLLGKANRSALFSAKDNEPKEKIAALMASSVLAAMTQGKLVDPQSGESLDGDAAIHWAKRQIDRISGRNG